MERLTSGDEAKVSLLRDQLSHIVGLDDMFPPPEAGIRQPAPEPHPRLPPAISIGEYTMQHVSKVSPRVLAAA